jgi:hypothetical protein
VVAVLKGNPLYKALIRGIMPNEFVVLVETVVKAKVKIRPQGSGFEVTKAVLPQAVQRHRLTLVPTIALFVTLLFISVSWLLSAGANAQDRFPNKSESPIPQALTTPPPPCAPGPGGQCSICSFNVKGESPYERSLPVPTPRPGFDYVVQLVNESSTRILAATNAANQGSSTPGGPVPSPVAVEPREGSWVMAPKGTNLKWPDGTPLNTLTIDIPLGWEGTDCPQSNPNCSANGPRFYPRTGCKYDIAHNLAQCETGTCGDAYDCGKQALRNPPEASAGRAPVSIVEWTFNAQGAQGYAYPDISLVDGASLTIDVQALGAHCATKPGAPTEPNWLSQNQPLAVRNSDLRSSSKCMKSFSLTRGQVGQIIQGGGGNPNAVVACFSNCGRYEYPGTPGADCNPDTDPACRYWKYFCCFTPPGDPDGIYGGKCTTDSDCGQAGGCWDLGGEIGKVCACRAFIKQASCPGNVCTHPNPPDTSSQPPFGHCSDVTGVPIGQPDTACIGDDTVHMVFPGAYTWPNDPQTYSSDARTYRLIFSPGGTPSDVSITKSAAVRSCSSFPPPYAYNAMKQNCADEIKEGAIFAGAIVSPVCTKDAQCPIIPGSNPPARYGCDTTFGQCATWACSIADGGPVSTGAILCHW